MEWTDDLVVCYYIFIHPHSPDRFIALLLLIFFSHSTVICKLRDLSQILGFVSISSFFDENGAGKRIA